MKAAIFNDIHLGVKRSSGTTPKSASELRHWLQDQFHREILKETDKHLVINGDLFDKFSIEVQDLIPTYENLTQWLRESDKNLYLLGGNHDFSARGDKISSFELLGVILQGSEYGDRVYLEMGGLTKLYNEHVWAIPHQLNQDLFDMELDKAKAQIPPDSVLLLHCNYDNHFAVESDHSLNISKDQARELTDLGIKLIIGHEHVKRVLRGGKVYITGNQFPTSVSDCLDENGAKYYHVLGEDLSLTPIQTWDNEGGFKQVEWVNIQEVEDEVFIRVTGLVPPTASQEVINTIAKFRSRSNAFVITNAVKIEGLETLEGFEDINLEDIKKFDVASALLELLDPREQEVIKSLLEA